MDKRVESMQVSVDIQDSLRRQRDEAVAIVEVFYRDRDCACPYCSQWPHHEKCGVKKFLAAVKEEG